MYNVHVGISGWWEAPLIDDVIHNRTVNLKGGLGHNIPMDQVCKLFNTEFKGASTVHMTTVRYTRVCLLGLLYFR